MMKKGDEYVGEKSGLRLKIRDITLRSVIADVQRRIVDKKTGEIVIEDREREISKDIIELALKGYKKV
jgi:hypothetical protein